jgi:uncharacterized membrane protein YvbJ
MVKCPGCGSKNSADRIFCVKCGNPLMTVLPASSPVGGGVPATGLRPCPACGNQVSVSALACPQCGHPFAVAGAQICPYCHQPTLMRMQGLYGAKEISIGLVLLALLIIPGLAYYFDVSKQPRCSTCNRRVK